MFTLDPTLSADTTEIRRLGLCRALLMNDATYPWLILVPEREGLRDLHDLDMADHATLMAEITRASNALQTLFNPDKINVAALGNVVEQLHVHIIARLKNDRAWPAPVWGAVPPVPYAPDTLEERVSRLRSELTPR